MGKVEKRKSIFHGDLEQTLAVHLSILYKDKGSGPRLLNAWRQSEDSERKGDERGTITILNNRGSYV